MPKRKSSKYAIENKNIIAVFSVEDNPNVDLSKISEGSHQKVICKCPVCNTKWTCEIRKNKDRNACPSCAKKKLDLRRSISYANNFNSLRSLFPKIAEEWDKVKNDPLFNPDNIAAYSKKSIYWVCPNGHSYKATVSNRTRMNSGCPYCSGQKVLVGYNDLATVNPYLAKQWSTKNEFKASEVTIKSNKIVYWSCPFGHKDYLMSVKQRSNHHGCPICASQSQTSFPEQAIYYYIKRIFPDALNRYICDSNIEIDIFIPSYNLGIEYNGNYYHKNKREKDEDKREKLNKIGIELLVVDEFKTQSDKRKADFYIRENYTMDVLSELIRSIIKYINPNIRIVVDCEKDFIRIKEQYTYQIKEKSIGNFNSKLVAEWDNEKNGRITPYMVSCGSKLKYYWICPICKNSYIASPKDRKNGINCPYCSHRLVKEGLNDLETIYPQLLKRWDYAKNKSAPSKIYAGGRTKYYWKCDEGHSYLSTIPNEVKRKVCPVCSGKIVLSGYNDLLSQLPLIAEDWDYELNLFKPSEIHFNNQSEIIHWKCKKCGFKWTSTVKQHGLCPNCKKKHMKINVYMLPTMEFYDSFENIKVLCANLGIDYNKQKGNISSVCNKKQKSLLNKYVLRHADDDEFQKNK